MSTTWAPSGHQHASVQCLSPILVQKVADLLRVGYSWSELSELATFLVCLNGKMGHMLRQQLRPKRDAMMFVADKRLITACYHIKEISSCEMTWQLGKLIISQKWVTIRRSPERLSRPLTAIVLMITPWIHCSINLWFYWCNRRDGEVRACLLMCRTSGDVRLVHLASIFFFTPFGDRLGWNNITSSQLWLTSLSDTKLGWRLAPRMKEKQVATRCLLVYGSVLGLIWDQADHKWSSFCSPL